MAPPLAIAVVCPHAWPLREDAAYHAAAEAAALARRGHRVTVLAPADGRARLVEGRERLRRVAAGEAEALLPAPGGVREIALGRAFPTGAGRRLGGPLDLAGALETALAGSPFDVVHVHEPLAPSPVLAALRHAPGATAATFHRAEQLTGVAFLRPLVDRALGRADLRITTSEVGRRALLDLLPGDYRVLRPGVDPPPPRPPHDPAAPPGLVLVARGRERVGARFALGVVRQLADAPIGPVTLLGPPETPWRTRAAVPKALRERVRVVADAGPAARAELLAGAGIALLATTADALGPVLAEAMAAGLAVVAPLSPELEVEGEVHHGREAVLLPPFSRAAWAEAVAALAADPGRRAALGAGASARGRARGWDQVAAELEAAYREAIAGPRRAAGAPSEPRVEADLRIAPGPDVSPEAVVAACVERGLGAVAVAARGGLEPARAVAALAPPELAVIVGQEIATPEGVFAGLFLTRPVPDGLALADAMGRVREQGGLVLVPHPASVAVPAAAALRRVAGLVDCHEVLTGPGPNAAAGRAGEEAAWLARRLGLAGCAGSGASDPTGIGTARTELRPFHGPEDFLNALADAQVRRRRRPGRARPARRRRPPGDG